MENINFDQAIQNFLFRVGSQIANEAKAVAPVVTSNLKNDIQVFDDNISDGEIAIGNSNITPYAKYVHGGTKNEDGSTRLNANPYLINGIEEYISGGLERALSDLQDEAGEELVDGFIDNIRATMRNIS